MIIRDDKTYETNSLFLDTNWYENEDNYILDETTKEGRLMAQLYMDNFPFVDFEHERGIVTNVIILDDERKIAEQEKGEQELLEKLKPSDKEVLMAEVELNTINLLLEMEVIQ